MIIAGINAYHADASAAIFRDGVLIAAIEEERFTRIKHTAGFPARALEFCLLEAGVNFEDVDYYCIGRDTKAKFLKKILFLASHPAANLSAVRGRLRNRKEVKSFENELSNLSGLAATDFKGKLRHVEHHRSHIASSFFASPFEEAACISIDGSGDFTTTMTAIGKGNHFKVIDSLDFPHSIGIFYTAFTQFLGFPFYGDEYKVMGMAPYGKPVYVDKIKDIIAGTKDGFFRLDLSYFTAGSAGIISYDKDNKPDVAKLYNEKFARHFGAPRSGAEPITGFHHDMAASVQCVTEEIIFHLLRHLHHITNQRCLCLSGGVAQNSVANGKIIANTPFEEIYIPPAAHDAGISMGAAMYIQHEELELKRYHLRSAYSGSSYSEKEIVNMLDAMNLGYQRYDDAVLYSKVADCLISGGVTGWFTGRSEFGPRALGGRSILADPRKADAKEILNVKIKRRENFRPFAPAILKEHVAEYFESAGEVPFMEKVYQIRSEKRKTIPAVTHVDGSGRLQTVDRKVSPRFYALIETFFSKTGVPILLNTSFNENEPIVNTPEEAINCYLRTNMDMLVLENYVVSRNS